MTAKRFTHKMNQLGVQFICYDDKAELLGTFADDIGVTNIVELLNALHEENERLKEEKEKWKSNCSLAISENSILWNEINILREQGAEPSEAFNNYLNKKRSHIK